MIDYKKTIIENKEKYLNELIELLKIPSISADPVYKKDVSDCADFVANSMTNIGLDNVKLIQTEGFPVAFGQKIIDQSKPTVLIYGHYDVQPVDPIELWNSKPFEPIIKNDNIFARGAADDKGQFFIHFKALEMLISKNLLNFNVKVIIEGEEEIGSINLEKFAIENKELLKSDFILISDTSMISLDTPSITTGLRGLCYMEIDIIGPNRDLHSGVYGGAVANPINSLCEIIAKLKDSNGTIQIPGFYDKVVDVSVEDKKSMSLAPFDLDQYKKHLDIDDVYGESEYSVLERVSIRPTLDVNGIIGGYTGEGAKTVLPSLAHAKVSMRLVPNQDFHEIEKLFENYILSLAPKNIKVKVTAHHGGEPAVTPTDSYAYKLAHNAILKSFGKEPIPLRTGGSIPIVTMFKRVLEIDTVLLGFGLDTDAIHSPNEHFGVNNFMLGVETICHLLSSK